MHWNAATAPTPGVGEPVAVEVADALLTGFDRGRLHVDPRATGSPTLWMTGAVHDGDGRLVPQSQRLWMDDPQAPAPCDPHRVRVPERGRRLEGTWLYAGHWTGHFGHFLVEVLTNLWPERSSWHLSGLIGHRSFRGDVAATPGAGRGMFTAGLHDWQHDLLRMTGYDGLPVRVVRSRPVHVDRLVVPSRPVVLKNYALPPAVRVWQRLAASVTPHSSAQRSPTGPRRLYLSRTEFHHRHRGDRLRVRSTRAWDRTLDRTLVEAGFTSVSPETLSVTEQIRLVTGADVVAGLSGSALHLSAVAGPGCRVLELGDARGTPSRTQRMIDAATGHLTAFAPYQDLAALEAVLADLGRPG